MAATDAMTRSASIETLPPHAAERIRVLRDAIADDHGTHVVYWMHHAVRAHENPALDVARLMASRLGLPLVVYQGLGGRHRFNSDRHHTFIMEGAADVRRELASVDPAIRYVFWLPESPSEPSPLTGLASNAALVIAEDFPAPPFPAWTARLAERCGRPVWLVDACCIVPMRLIDGEYLRAFKFRNKARKLFRARVERDWPGIDAPLPAADGVDLGFEPLDLDPGDDPARLAELCAGCDIDHSVAPVAHTRGGGRAGYERWEAFKSSGLKSYHKRRNRAEIERHRLAVSRMSPYLHHGHVSPMRLAREAHALMTSGVGDGAEKYLDELWTWRELAHHLCYHYPDTLESADILPGWARDTLREHKDDPRDVKSWETLARGRAGDRLWDTAQRSLLAHGELHNNVRMTWGKAIVPWSEGAAAAQRTLIDLNHRFALDGNDPNSYGGLLWCLGVLDRPFENVDEPVTGRLRPRPLDQHAGRMDLDRYEADVGRAPWAGGEGDRWPRVAVVGGGMAGLAAARALADHNAEVTVFDKGRGPGGRMSTRRVDLDRGDAPSASTFDHGAQYFTARDERFARLVRSWVDDGIAEPWRGRLGAVDQPGSVVEKRRNPDRYVGTPAMNAVIRHMADTLGGTSKIHFGTRVSSVLREEGDTDGAGAWRLLGDDPLGHDQPGHDQRDLGVFDAVIVAVPAPQAVELLAGSPELRRLASSADMRPAWAAMAEFDRPVGSDFDGVFVNIGASPLSWVSRDSSKPQRPQGERWVLHAGPEWSEAHLERDPDDVASLLLAAFFEAMGLRQVEPLHLSGHRWRHANTAHRFDRGCLFDRERLIGVCGDWCHGGRVEGAYLSGAAVAGSLLGEIVGRARTSRAP